MRTRARAKKLKSEIEVMVDDKGYEWTRKRTNECSGPRGVSMMKRIDNQNRNETMTRRSKPRMMTMMRMMWRNLQRRR
jgi:hypothetical protein